MDRRFLAILAGLVVIFIGLFILTSNSSDDQKNTNPANLAGGHSLGQGKSGVTLVEYGDFQCPVCSLYHQPLKQVIAKNGEQIYFQFRNLPLVSAHPHAFAAARAAEAAGLQNKFWEMHDKLYENQSTWAGASDPVALFKSYAATLGLNAGQFSTDYASSQVNDIINADIAAFTATNQPMATPTFFLDGKVLKNTDVADQRTGAPDVEKFTAKINEAINSKKQ